MKSFHVVRKRGGWAIVLVVLSLPQLVSAQTEEESRWGDSKETYDIVLTRRASNGPYGNSAFSFRTSSQDLAKHRNYVDLVYNGCGWLHFNPVGGMQSRVADLGEHKNLNVKFDRNKKRAWATQAYLPEKGHVYWQEITLGSQTMTVSYRVQNVEHDKVKLRWTVVKKLDGAALPRGMAGTMGQCAGPHGAR